MLWLSRSPRHIVCLAAAALVVAGFSWSGFSCLAQNAPAPERARQPWMNTALSPDQRADLVEKQMTLDEKMNFVHGTGWNGLRAGAVIPKGSVGGAGYVQGVPRLGIPGINMADSAVGVRLAAQGSHYATLLPSVLGASSSWDPKALFLFGDVIGRELRDMGYNMSIGGGGDLMRDPRNGRNFEYAGEDPLLAGTMVGELAKGLQSNDVMGDIKHYAFNDEETGRTIYNAQISQRAARESDLLAFQIAIGLAHPAGVMCSYNKDTITPPGGTDWSCENDYLLNQVLKKDFDFKGFVLSDWGGTHSTVHAALSGLDQEQPGSGYFGDPLKKAVEDGQVPAARLDDMVHRVLRSMFATGVVDHPPVEQVVNPFRGRDDAEHIADESIVLMKNEENVLPLHANLTQSIAVIGSHADVGVLSGGGSAQVDAPGENAVHPHPGTTSWGEVVWFPSSPLREIRKQAPNAKVTFDEGSDPRAAAKVAAEAQIAMVFVNQPMHEGMDAATIDLPDNQNALVDAVAAANRHTIVVLETGGPVAMPWADRVAGIVEAWYPGIGGAQSLAAILFGQVDPSGRLPATFARDDAQLPRPEVPGIRLTPGGKAHHGDELPPFNADYNIEGARVGYKWFESEHKAPLFPFGFGLSYTTFAFSDLHVDDATHAATFTVRNTGDRAGAEVAQVYAVLPQSTGESNYKRLVGWNRVTLAAGESKTVTVGMNPLTLSIFDVARNAFTQPAGDYQILVGSSSADTPLTAAYHVGE
ncbi:MAG TPA: glycoside hydrolase family 3 C-terminal domain-containing protein [Acidobacteriaceae bacterium]|jgi:beta-glucosidase|nr:glycoside hydrolase family 3 C-terminal domain-containing protein [Acidobacteriaceae bacterium]